MFEIEGLALYLKAGTPLGHESNPVLDVTVAVDDTTIGGTPDDTANLSITVEDVNVAPALGVIGNRTIAEETPLTFTATATDADLPVQVLTFNLSGAPAGASIDPATGVFTWTPTEAQGPADYTFTVVVSDGSLTDTETITVTVQEVNIAPVLSAIGNRTVAEETTLTFTATASDTDLPANVLTFSLSGAPAGASIDPVGGVFTWTPTEAEGPADYTFAVVVSDGLSTDSETITVTVQEVNVAPVLGAIGNRTVAEETLLTFTATATDADLPAQPLTFSLTGAPAGASIDPTTGVFTWTPTEAQGPTDYTFAVVVSDGLLTDAETITVTVQEVNVAPVLGAIGNRTVAEETLLTFMATASDTDLPANVLTFNLSGAPAGASIDPATGVFTWTPTEAQGPAEYTFDVVVSDGLLTDSETITVTVQEVNVPPAPSITGISQDSGTPGDGVTNDQTLTITGTAEADNLISLFLNGAGIGTTRADSSGTWGFDYTSVVLADGTYVLTATATDAAGGTSVVSASFPVTVDTAAPVVTVDSLTTSDPTPPLTGTVNDPDAFVDVIVGGATYAAANNGDGTSTRSRRLRRIS